MRTLVPLLSLVLASSAWAGPRVAVVQSDDLAPYVDPVPAFLRALDEPALVINLHGREAEADKAVERLRREDPKVVFCLGAKAAWAVRHGLPNTPLVYASVLEPDRYGIPGPQTTGVEMTVSPDAYLSQFVGFFPQVQRIGVFRGPSTPDDRMAELERAAQAVGATLVVQEVGSPKEVRAAIEALAPRVDGLWLQPDRSLLTRESFRALSEEARRRRMPLLVATDNMVRAGGLFSVVPDYAGLGQQAADISQKILDGMAPSIIPVEHPEAVLVALNLGTVRAAEIEFEELLLDFVDVVVE